MSKQHVTGSYFAVKFSEMTKNEIIKYVERYEIPNPTHRDLLHATVMFASDILTEPSPEGLIVPMIQGKFKCFSIWNTKPTDDGTIYNCLVLKFLCPALIWRHKYLMSRHYPDIEYQQYIPHITLSYDIGDMSIYHLPAFEGLIEIVEEYHERRENFNLRNIYHAHKVHNDLI